MAYLHSELEPKGDLGIPDLVDLAAVQHPRQVLCDHVGVVDLSAGYKYGWDLGIVLGGLALFECSAAHQAVRHLVVRKVIPQLGTRWRRR